MGQRYMVTSRESKVKIPSRFLERVFTFLESVKGGTVVLLGQRKANAMRDIWTRRMLKDDWLANFSLGNSLLTYRSFP